MNFKISYKNFKMEFKRRRQPFVYMKSEIEEKTASNLFNILRDCKDENGLSIWSNGIKDKTGVSTRKAYIVTNTKSVVFNLLYDVIKTLLYKTYSALKYDVKNIESSILGIYLNYYENGNDYAPIHNHRKQGTHQMVISLGDSRTFVLGSKEFEVKNGDAMFFGYQNHGIKRMNKEKSDKGRISIAVFTKPIF